MKRITIEEAKKIELDILTYIDKLCKQHDIKYFINYGSLIGAIRHKGFIPWDDDIDISMPREDYDRFVQLFKEDKSKYKILSLDTQKEYFNNFAKVIDSSTVINNTRVSKSYPSGIFIDVFPMDTFDNKKIVDICYILESFKLLTFVKKSLVVRKDSKLKDFIRFSSWLLLRPISPRVFAYLIERYIKKYSKKDGKFIAFLPSKLKHKEVFEKETFDKLINRNFEHLTVPIPENYDKILMQYYGNYMDLPPEEERYGHEFEAYKIEKKEN